MGVKYHVTSRGRAKEGKQLLSSKKKDIILCDEFN